MTRFHWSKAAAPGFAEAIDDIDVELKRLARMLDRLASEGEAIWR